MQYEVQFQLTRHIWQRVCCSTITGYRGIYLSFSGNTTGSPGIHKVIERDGAIYNLSGMRVSKTQKGVYIMNGRKVIVK